MPAETPASEELRRYEIQWGAYKAIGVAFVSITMVGLFSAWLNWQFQNRQLEVEKEQTIRVQKLKVLEIDSEIKIRELNQQQEYLTQFTSFAMSKNLQSRIDFAQYVAHVATDKNLRNLWKEYHKVLENDASDTRADRKAASDQLQALLQQSKEMISENQFEIQRLLKRIASLESELAPSSTSKSTKFYSMIPDAREQERSTNITGDGYQFEFTSRVISNGRGHWKYVYEVKNRSPDTALVFSAEKINISIAEPLPPGLSMSWTYSDISPPNLIGVTLRIGPDRQQTHIVDAYAPNPKATFYSDWNIYPLR